MDSKETRGIHTHVSTLSQTPLSSSVTLHWAEFPGLYSGTLFSEITSKLISSMPVSSSHESHVAFPTYSLAQPFLHFKLKPPPLVLPILFILFSLSPRALIIFTYMVEFIYYIHSLFSVPLTGEHDYGADFFKFCSLIFLRLLEWFLTHNRCSINTGARVNNN